MPREPNKLRAWYETYNAVVKRQMVLTCNRSYGKKFKLNMTVDEEANIDTLYLTRYYNEVGHCPDYKNFDYDFDWEEMIDEAKCELKRLKHRLTVARRRRQRQVDKDSDLRKDE